MSSDRDGGHIPGPAEHQEEPQDAGRPRPSDGTGGTDPQAGPSGSPQDSGAPEEPDLHAPQGVHGGPDQPEHAPAAYGQAEQDQAGHDPAPREQAGHDEATQRHAQRQTAYAHAYRGQAPDQRPYAQAYGAAPPAHDDLGRSYENVYPWQPGEEQPGEYTHPPQHEPMPGMGPETSMDQDTGIRQDTAHGSEPSPDADAPPFAPPPFAHGQDHPYGPDFPHGQDYLSQPGQSADHDYWPQPGHPAEPPDSTGLPGAYDQPGTFDQPAAYDQPGTFDQPAAYDQPGAAVPGMPPGPGVPGPAAPATGSAEAPPPGHPMPGHGIPGQEIPGHGTPGPKAPGQKPPRRHGKARLMATLAAAVALLVVMAVVVLNMAGDSGGKGTARRTVPPDSAAGRAQRAAQYLSGVPALRFSGTFASGGSTAQTDLWVTKVGSAVGTITIDGDEADVVIIDGETYVKAGEAFWRSHGGEPANPQDYADRWSRAPAAAFDLDLARTLDPGAILQRLRSAATSADAAALSSAPTEYVNSVPAIKVGPSRGALYLSAAAPYKLLRMSGTGSQNYQLDVAEPTVTQVTAMFTRLRQSVRKLAGSRDPSVKFVGGQLAFSNCNNNVSGCTLQLTATKVSTSATTGDVRAVMLGKIIANGRTLGTCRGGEPLRAGRTVRLSCTVSSAGWRDWMRKARSTPGSHRYNAEARVVAEALSAAEVNALLKGIDQEQQAA